MRKINFKMSYKTRRMLFMIKELWVSFTLKVRIFFHERRKKRGIYYVNGTDVLPPPLTKEEESSLIDRLHEDEEASKILIEHNLRLVVYIAKRFENTGAGLEDLVSIGTIGLIKAINTFRADKNIKLATYASRCIENEILMYIRKSSGTKSEVSIDEPLNTDWDGNELLLSDILGSDEDSVSYEIEQAEERERGLSVNLYGQASTTWVNRLLIIPIGPATLHCSVSSIWRACRKTASTSIAAIGTRKWKPSTSFLTGHGRDAKAK